MKSVALPLLMALAISTSAGPAFCHGGGGFHGGGFAAGSTGGFRNGVGRGGCSGPGAPIGGTGFHHGHFGGHHGYPFWGLGAYGYGYGYDYGYANDYGNYVSSEQAKIAAAEGKRFDEENRKQIKRLQSLPHNAFVKTYNWPATGKMAGSPSSHAVRSGQIAAKRPTGRQPL